MSSRSKLSHYHALKGAAHYDADLKLLQETDPNNKLLKRQIAKSEKSQKDILWMLLDLVSADDIVKNRRAFNKENASKKDNEADAKAAEEAAKLEQQKREAMEAAKKVISEKEVSEFSYQEKKKLVKVLEIETPDQKQETLDLTLREFKKSLPSEGNAAKEPVADSEKKNTPEQSEA